MPGGALGAPGPTGVPSAASRKSRAQPGRGRHVGALVVELVLRPQRHARERSSRRSCPWISRAWHSSRAPRPPSAVGRSSSGQWLGPEAVDVDAAFGQVQAPVSRPAALGEHRRSPARRGRCARRRPWRRGSCDATRRAARRRAVSSPRRRSSTRGRERRPPGRDQRALLDHVRVGEVGRARQHQQRRIRAALRRRAPPRSPSRRRRRRLPAAASTGGSARCRSRVPRCGAAERPAVAVAQVRDEPGPRPVRGEVERELRVGGLAA